MTVERHIPGLGAFFFRTAASAEATLRLLAGHKRDEAAAFLAMAGDLRIAERAEAARDAIERAAECRGLARACGWHLP